MSNQSARLQSYGCSRNVNSVATTAPQQKTRTSSMRVPPSHFLSTYGFAISTMSYKEEIGFCFDAADTMEAFIDISEICEMELNTDGTETATIKQQYSIRSTWRTTIAQRVLDDIINGNPQFTKIEALLITDDDFMITFRNPDGTDGNCGHPNTFPHKMENVVKMNAMFQIMVKIQAPDVVSLGIRPRDSLATGSRFTTATPPGTTVHNIHAPASTPPPVAPNKLEFSATIDLKKITNKSIPALTKSQDIQCWYNVSHSRGRICRVYTVPWEAFTKASYMGTTWTLTSLDQEIMDRKEHMSDALHGLLSATDMFLGDCKEYTHLISNSQSNGYLALFQIVRLTHPILGQVAAQKEQPQQRKRQPFSEHVSHYLDYFQSEACSGSYYPLNE
jgi:hypothetical protein